MIDLPSTSISAGRTTGEGISPSLMLKRGEVGGGPEAALVLDGALPGRGDKFKLIARS